MLRTSVLRRLPPPINRYPPVAHFHHRPSCSRQLQHSQFRLARTSSLLVIDPDRLRNARHIEETSRAFHSTAKRDGWPIIGLYLASALKTSASLEFVRMAGRIALTFVPVVLMGNHKARRYIRHVIQDKPELEEKKLSLQNKIRKSTIFYRTLIVIPLLLFSLTLISSVERTPLTGRWRLILLSPEEENEIAAQLAGTGWYQAVGEILNQDSDTTPSIIPPTDWRYKWVLSVLRLLESTIPILAAEKDAGTQWLDRGPDDLPLPPPAKYPLKQRPNAKEYLRWFCDMHSAKKVHPTAHNIPGPPYSLLIVDKPDCQNAFSYGFGPDGGGGIVVYSGFLDEILSQDKDQNASTSDHTSEGGFWSSLLGALSPPPSPQAPHPTPEQTERLAILLAHELAHLILSHHLETLSTGTVIIPGTVSLVADIVRALAFPITMMFGPFVNDAVANLGKLGQGEVGKLHEYCTSIIQEYEADTVSTRLLAHSGFDARSAVTFWETRHAMQMAECTPKYAEENKARPTGLARRIMGATHPVHEDRVLRLKAELDRWVSERDEVLASASPPSRSGGSPTTTAVAST
ncbi:hypothetical protein BD410DRAFT_755349 [Rickenella mellea]|uniref:Peptidase M48 domain-containing protein n=1 Tax=Rickenella mellea TaxID=50990 RepID=A0A4Y7PNY7_9AGAM|nr:hypothetical protein BD410DRAFT_755349 [Rickenella mellea]